MNRQAILAGILASTSGNTAATQRARLHTALQQLGAITTIEARGDLDIMMPAARVHELRHTYGLNIVTSRVHRPTAVGKVHSVGIYALLPQPGGRP